MCVLISWNWKVWECCAKVWEFLRRLKIELSYDLAIPLLDIDTNEWKAGLKQIFVLPFHSSIVHSGKKVETIHVSIKISMDKQMWDTYTHNDIVRHKKEWNFDICYNMGGLENIIPSDISQTQMGKYYMIPLIWGT